MREAPIIREDRLKLIQGHISQMPSLSTTVTRVLEICNSPSTSPHDLNRVISLDPVLTGQVLKLVNSTYYSLPQKVNSLTRAIIMVGLNTVVNIAVSAAILERLGGKHFFQALSVDEFWTHSICVGVTAKSLAAIKGIPVTEREGYFVGGLLHDLGKIPLNERFPDEYFQALELAKGEQDRLDRFENMVLGIDHCMVGKMIADKWQLSQVMSDSISYHHAPEEAGEENREFVAIVALANTYANILDIGSSGDPFPEEAMTGFLLECVGIGWDALSGLSETVLDEVEKAKVFLTLMEKG